MRLITSAVAIAAAFAAIGPPIHGLAHDSTAWHMVQHLLLTAIAAPGIAAGLRGTVATTLPRQLVAATAGGRWRWWAIGSLLAAVATLWFWHLPGPYDAAVGHAAVHMVEHASLLLTASVFWWVLYGLGRRRRYGAAVLVAFSYSLSSIALGAGLTLARRPWYATGRAPADALRDQQIAGVLMWAYAGALTTAIAVLLFAGWLRWHERAWPGTPRPAGGPAPIGEPHVHRSADRIPSRPLGPAAHRVPRRVSGGGSE